MFSQMCVCHSVQQGSYITITHYALDLTVQCTGSTLRTGPWPQYRAPLPCTGPQSCHSDIWCHDWGPDQKCPLKENTHWCRNLVAFEETQSVEVGSMHPIGMFQLATYSDITIVYCKSSNNVRPNQLNCHSKGPVLKQIKQLEACSSFKIIKLVP